MTIAEAQDWFELVVAILAILGVGWRVIAAIDRRLDEVDGHNTSINKLNVELRQVLEVQKELHTKIDGIGQAIRPTNGDQRSISDRVDTVKKDVKELQVGLADVHNDIEEHTKTDAKNFGAIARWSNQFKEFDPMELPE